MSDARARTEQLRETLQHLVPIAIARIEAADPVSRLSLSAAWRSAARETDLSRHIRDGEPMASVDIEAHARVIALQSCRIFGVTVCGLIFCALHHRNGLPTNGEIIACPDCYDGPEFWDDDGTDLDLMTSIGRQRVELLDLHEGNKIL